MPPWGTTMPGGAARLLLPARPGQFLVSGVRPGASSGREPLRGDRIVAGGAVRGEDAPQLAGGVVSPGLDGTGRDAKQARGLGDRAGVVVDLDDDLAGSRAEAGHGGTHIQAGGG